MGRWEEEVLCVVSNILIKSDSSLGSVVGE